MNRFTRYFLFPAGIVVMLAVNCFGQLTQSLDTSSCAFLIDRGDRNFQSEFYQRANDTLRLFIENCANLNNAWLAFGTIGASVQYMDGPIERWEGYREWLKKVLYYNTADSDYYCADVHQISPTFAYYEGHHDDMLAFLAVLKYIKESGRCKSWSDVKDYDTLYANTIRDIIIIWRDTVKDSIATPLDTTIPSLEERGLSILRGQNSVAGGASPAIKRLANFTTERNPFTDEVALKVELNSPTMLRLDIFDELGHEMYGEGLGFKQPGEYTYRITSKGWASGVYYARLATSGGEVMTVKLIKE